MRSVLERGYRTLQQALEDPSYLPLQKTGKQFIVSPPPDLRRRLGAPGAAGDVVFGATAIPEESWPEDGHLYLTEDPDRVDQAIRAALAHKGQWSGELLLTEQLRHEALVYVYRILFCLYAEARGRELGILPISDDVYRLGYSLEALRDLADRGEPGTTAENGSYWAQHLDRLFRLIYEGFHPEAFTGGEQAPADRVEDVGSPWRTAMPHQHDLFGDDRPRQLSLGESSRKAIEHGYAKAFVIQPLTATLFDPEATPLLKRVQLANRVLHKVIRCLSLGTGERGKQIGRINYAELGLVQLGSVYEGLLSYKGFFATEDLIQVLQAPKKKGGEQPVVYDDDIDPKTPTWFVPKTRLEEFKKGEVVIERRTKQSRIYKTGEFILHLNGVDRVNGACYYTPAVLTETLVRETVKERLKDIGLDQADEILELKICEPAMGSAAFLVEALGQLADRYLALKQEQVGRSIEPDAYEHQRRRVMHYIAVHNVHGVDLNPTAVELGALSRAVPWYDVARESATGQPFHHWELVFTEVLGPRYEGQAEPPRGFDLMFGNPPWIKVSWNDAPLLAEFEPRLGVRDAKSATYNRERGGLLEAEHRRFAYRDSFEQGEGAGVFLNDRTLYPNLAGVQTNLYKNFIERSWAGRALPACCIRRGCSTTRRAGCFGRPTTGACWRTISSRTSASCSRMCTT
jgi:hypothetical protein